MTVIITVSIAILLFAVGMRLGTRRMAQTGAARPGGEAEVDNGKAELHDGEAELHEGDAEVGLAPTSGFDGEWLRVLAHELRTPIGAILGYGELLSDGTFGPLEPRAVDAVRRVRGAADQLLALVEGLDETDDGPAATPASVAAGALLAEAAAALTADAQVRGVRLVVEDSDAVFVTDAARAARALRLALGGAIKASPGAVLQLSAETAPVPHIIIRGSQLDPLRDMPGPPGSTGTPVTGAGLRLRLALRAVRRVQGTVRLDGPSQEPQLQITLPPLLIDDSEQRP
jgi:signal transduction histidine kinase